MEVRMRTVRWHGRGREWCRSESKGYVERDAALRNKTVSIHNLSKSWSENEAF